MGDLNKRGSMWWSRDRVKEVVTSLDRILERLDEIIIVLQQGERIMSVELDALVAQVAQNTSVEASAVQLIQGLAAQIVAAQADPAKLADLTGKLQSSASALAQAITSNTPAQVAPAQ